MRSLLFVPGDDERKMAKALGAGADALILDLEDSVAPENRARARALTAEFLRWPRADGARRFVRVNALASGAIDDDLDAVMAGAPDGLLLPKCRNGADVQALGARLAVHEAEHGLDDGGTKIIAIATESAAAMFGLASYAGCSARLIGLAWGAEDLGAEIGVERRRDADGRHTDVFRLARTLTLLGAAAAGVTPIDAVFPDFRDGEGLNRACDEGRADGFRAKMAIHPAQVAPINAAFTPSAQALAHANAVVAAFAAKPGAGVVALDGAMLDRPHLVQALRVLGRG